MIQIKNLSLENKQKAVLALCVLLLALDLIFFLGRMLIGSLKNVSDWQTARKEIDLIVEDSKRSDEYALKLKELNEEVKRFEEQIANEKEIPVFLGRISKIAKELSVDIENIVPIIEKDQPLEPKKSYYKKTPIKVNALGGYHEFGKFLNRIEFNDRFMEVAGLSISANDGDPERHNIELIINLIMHNRGDIVGRL